MKTKFYLLVAFVLMAQSVTFAQTHGWSQFEGTYYHDSIGYDVYLHLQAIDHQDISNIRYGTYIMYLRFMYAGTETYANEELHFNFIYHYEVSNAFAPDPTTINNYSTNGSGSSYSGDDMKFSPIPIYTAVLLPNGPPIMPPGYITNFAFH